MTDVSLPQRGIMLGNFQFLYFDFVLTTSMAVVMGNIGPPTRIHPQRPLSRILTPKNLIPLFLQLLVCALIQRASLYYLESQNWQVSNINYCVAFYTQWCPREFLTGVDVVHLDQWWFYGRGGGEGEGNKSNLSLQLGRNIKYTSRLNY